MGIVEENFIHPCRIDKENTYFMNIFVGKWDGAS